MSPNSAPDDGAAMSEWQTHRQFGQTAQKWRALVERRRTAIVALYRSGDWKKMYTEDRFMALLREAVTSAETWARVAPPPAGEPQERNEPVADQPHRTAA